MKKVSIALALIACLALPAAVPAAARTSGVERIPVAVDGVIRGDLGAARSTPMTSARWALDRYQGELGIEASDFRFESVRRSIIGTHIRGREFIRGIPVDVTSAAVHIIDGRIVQIEARGTRSTGVPTPAPIEASVAEASALAHLGVRRAEASTVERMLVGDRGRLVDTYRVTVFSLEPAVAAQVDVVALDGAVWAVRDGNRYANGTATVFDPNPMVTSKNKDLRQPGVDEGGADTDLDSAELTAQLKSLPVKEYDATQIAAGRLVGPWASVQGPAPLVSTTAGAFNYTRSDPRFETVMAYTHIDRYQRYLQDILGFEGDTAINAEPQDVYALPIAGYDNSFYQPGNDIMAFGAGGVDDGEDAEVILHEYGHAVQDAQVKGWGATNEGGAMGEGFGDFQAAAYYARTSGGFQDLCVAEWDATSYSSATPPCLRRLDSTKKYPKDVKNQVHADGEMWSAFLWRVRAGLLTDEMAQDMTPQEEAVYMSDNSLRLVLASHELLTTTAKFKDAVLALIGAAKALDHPEWEAVIRAEADATGLLK